MKLNNFYKALLCIAASAIMLVGCEREKLVKPSALLSESSIEFAAIGAEPQLLTIASDEDWMVDAPEWITVDPMQGSKTMKVTVSVTDNVDKNGIKAAPRDGIITIALTRNNYSIEVLVRQKGDKYLNAADYTVSEAAALTDEVAVKIPEAGVMAATASAFVISDGSANMYVKGANTVKAGDKIALNGSISTKEGVPALIVDEVEVKGNEELSYPEPEDINGKLGDYKPAAVNYVTVDGTVLGASLISGTASATLVESEVIEEVNTHKATLCAYYVGKSTYLVVSAKDNGADENVGTPLPFVEDFSWFEPYVAAYNATNPAKGPVSDCVANSLSSADGAVNVYSNAVMTAANPVTGLSFMDDFHARGYTDINGEKTSMYLQDMYLKFGKTGAGNRQALGLPRFRIDGTDNVVVSWDYCAQLQGDGTPDKVMLVLEITGPGKVTNPASKEEVDNKEKRSDIIAVNQEKSECHWQRASVTVEGVTTATTFSIVPSNWKETNAHRFYIDNISVMLESQAVPATITITGLNNNSVLFKGVPEGPVSFDVVSDKFYTITTSDNWVHVSETGGEAGEKKTVEITCDASSLSEPREAKIVVTSGITTEEIVVYQSAAGQQLMTSVALDKSRVTVLGEGESFEINTQYTDPYEVKIEADWISELTTRNLAEFGHHTFIAKPNTTGAARTGTVIFSIPGTTAEAILLVTQENFEPRIDVTTAGNLVYIAAEGATVKAHISANIDFYVESDIVTMPTELIPAGEYDYDLIIPAFTGTSREIVLTFKNEKYSYTKDYRVDQLGSEALELFADDFEWLAPVVEAYKASKPGNYDTVGKHDLKAEAPNIYTTAALKDAVIPKLTEIGYIIPGKDAGANNVLYLQENYLKMGKTSSASQTSLTLPFFPASGQDVIVSFDWCRMEQGDGTIDNYTITLKIEGSGTFVNGTKYSDELTTPQKQGEMFWTNVAAKIVGANADTRITVVATALLDKSTGKIDYTKSGGRRMFIDNIKVMAL